MRSAAPLAAFGLAAGLAVAVYLPGLPGEFVYDDHRLITANEGLRRPLDVRRAFLRDYYASDEDRLGLGYYRPIAILSNELDFRRGGGAALPFHLTNIFLHALCAAGVVALARRCTGPGWLPSGLAGALFAIHPAHAESVAFISGRVDPLATLFGLAAILLHLRAGPSRRAWIWSAAAGAAWFAALLSKEIAITIPVLAACAHVAQDGLPKRAELGHWAKRYALLLAPLPLYLALRWAVLGSLLGTGAEQASRLGQMPVVLGSYLAWLVCPPWGIHLEPAPVSGIKAALAAAVLSATLLGIVVLMRRRAFGVAAWLVWCVAALLPVAQIRPLETELSERFLYLPSVGACVLFGVLAGPSGRARTRRAALALACALGVVYVGIAVPRSIAWRDAVSLWSAKAKDDPNSLKAQLNLGRALAERGDTAGARAAYERAAILGPTMAAQAQAEFESLTGVSGSASIETLRRSLESAPDDGPLWSNLGFRLYEQKEYGQAVEAFTRAVERMPARSTHWLGLALAELQLGHFEQAAKAATNAIELNPDEDFARVVRAQCALHSGAPCEALRDLEGLKLQVAEEEAVREQLWKVARERCHAVPAPSDR